MSLFVLYETMDICPMRTKHGKEQITLQHLERNMSLFFFKFDIYLFDFFSDNFHFVFVFLCDIYKTSFFLQNRLFYCDVSFMFCLLFLTQTLNRPQLHLCHVLVTCWSRVAVNVFDSPRCRFCAAPRVFCGVQSEVFSLCIPESPCASLNTDLIRWIICLNSQNSNRVPRLPPALQVLCV